MATSAPRRPPEREPSLLLGPLVLAATLFVATLCAGITVLWLLDRSSDPGPWAVVVVVAAVAATIISAFAEGTWSARVTRTTELGNATRLFAVATVLLVVPTIILQVIDDRRGPVREARSTEAACPEGAVPDANFDDLELDTEQREVASCLRWWGVLPPEVVTFAAADTVLRGEMATWLDRLVAAGGAPLPEVPEVPPPDPASPNAGAISRVSAAGLLGSGDMATFGPGEPITRDQLATVINRAHRLVTGGPLPEPEEEAYRDLEGNVHAEAIEAVAAAGVLVGDDDGNFRPGAALTRGQVANTVARTLDLWVTNGVASPPA